MAVDCCSDRLCGPHAKEFMDDLRLIAGYKDDHPVTPLMDDLTVTITKTHKIGSFLPGGSGERPLMFHVMASEAVAHLVSTMRRVRWWMMAQYPHLKPPEDCPTKIAGWMLLLANLAGDHPHAPTMARRVRAAVGMAQKVIDRPGERKFLGLCEECDRPVYGDVDDKGGLVETYVECCDVISWAPLLREELVRKMEDQTAPASDLVGIVNELTGKEITPAAIRGMKRRGLPVAGYDERTRSDLFRVGDVTAYIAGRAERARLSCKGESVSNPGDQS